ncbi:TPA: cation-translocating P-type ATPase [Clostridioides difficile]|nr:cation-translocating P-type ATPase [Clostridioides difficile]CZR78984.1 Calcium-transporting ATPase 1 [Clostridioides difficile]VIB55926.1 P-type calcium transport ATPase [Clostridioides difficile]HBE9527404.1 cation-translocating P-type ATPase [Clostridioides difficile]HBF0045160.1 cation-translocating P-type ATPase [Clostridioides difficile]
MENHKQMPWHSRATHEILESLDSSEEGLTDTEAEKRLKENGLNELRKKPPRTTLQMLWSQITDAMVMILIGAAILSLIFGEFTEAFVILIIVTVNAVIGIVQEKKAESSLEALKNMNSPTARVMRDGEENVIPASNLVVGDIVFLEDGAMVPADLRLIETSSLKIQEASLTGESVPSEKDADTILPKECVLGDRSNMAYTSSIVTYGRGVGVVVATGMDTEVGNIAHLLDSQDDFDTPIKRKLNTVGKTLSVIGIIVCVVIFAIGAFYQRPLLPMFMIAISLAISIIPEGLPATATIVMALGVQRMAKRNALIRKLPAVETLGGATVICCDKTGTLTLNKMTVTHIAVNGDFESGKVTSIDTASEKHPLVYKKIVYAGALCNDACINPDKTDEILGDPTEGALIFMAKKFGIDQEALEEEYPRVFEQPFDSDRKCMTTVHNIDEKIIAYTKGAVDEILDLCTKILTSKGERNITEVDKKNIHELCLNMSKDALRVLGFAKREISSIPKEDSENIEYDLTFIGMVGMIDPPRTEVIDAVSTCKEAGIRTIMITGDHKVTATTIAHELGIWSEENTVISGDELDNLSDDELDEAVKNTTVFARVSPFDKLRIIQSLKRIGEVPAMTGDGVNDSPALKSADIGIAMGISGTDVAKDSSDMILMDDSFTTIAYAIKEGRRVYRNIQKVIQFLLVGNIAEILTLFVAILLNWDTPLLAVHILWVNLATATLPALALGVDPPSRNIMKHQPVKSTTLFEKNLIQRVVTQGIFVAIMTILAYKIGLNIENHSVGQTMAFCVLAFSQMLRAFSQRSNTDSMFNRNNGKNPFLLISFLTSAFLIAVILFVPVFRNAFNLTVLNNLEWLITIVLAIMSVIQVEVGKIIKRKKLKK